MTTDILESTIPVPKPGCVRTRMPFFSHDFSETGQRLEKDLLQTHRKVFFLVNNVVKPASISGKLF